MCHPNNPTGTGNGRDELAAFLDRVPDHVLVVLDQAYYEYIDDPDYADGVEEHFKQRERIVVLRTFSKIYGLAGLRVGYGIAPPDVVVATSKVRRAFDVTATAQAAAIASIGNDAEIAHRRAQNAIGRAALEATLREHGLEPAGPALGNFVYAEVGDGRALFEQLLRQGVIVRPLAGFGAPSAIRVSVGTPEENEFFAGCARPRPRPGVVLADDPVTLSRLCSAATPGSWRLSASPASVCSSSRRSRRASERFSRRSRSRSTSRTGRTPASGSAASCSSSSCPRSQSG